MDISEAPWEGFSKAKSWIGLTRQEKTVHIVENTIVMWRVFSHRSPFLLIIIVAVCVQWRRWLDPQDLEILPRGRTVHLRQNRAYLEVK